MGPCNLLVKEQLSLQSVTLYDKWFRIAGTTIMPIMQKLVESAHWR